MKKGSHLLVLQSMVSGTSYLILIWNSLQILLLTLQEGQNQSPAGISGSAGLKQ